MSNQEDLLKQILRNQVVIFRKLSEIEDKQHGRHTSSSYKNYAESLKKEAEKVYKETTDSYFEVG